MCPSFWCCRPLVSNAVWSVHVSPAQLSLLGQHQTVGVVS
jgi:hypothetical protein